MKPKNEKRLYLTSYTIVLVMSILVATVFFPPAITALALVPKYLRNRSKKFVPQQDLPVALQEAARWSRGRW